MTLKDVLNNIKDPRQWVNLEALFYSIRDNPSLRGMLYGYVAESEFFKYLIDRGMGDFYKPDDHKKTKSDCTLIYKGREFTIQLKSIQTNSLKEIHPGEFSAVVQNDASDKRKIKLPDGRSVKTTCYLVGEYDLLAVSLQPFLGDWKFAFKRNKDLRRSARNTFPKAIKDMLLASSEPITYPLTNGWDDKLEQILDKFDS